MTELTVVVGAQFGSEGKGAIAAHLTQNYGPDDVAIRVAGPNAGHTAYDSQGREWKLRCIPVAAVTSTDCQLYLAPGSEIDLEVLWAEIRMLEEAGHNVTDRIRIHPSATILLERNINKERSAGLVNRIGSTGKGIGAARAERIMRTAPTWDDFVKDSAWWDLDKRLRATDLTLQHEFAWQAFENILIEGTQGYGLGLHTQFYPQTTSSDCRAIDFMAMAGISPWASGLRTTIYLVARTFPIRVAGNSGPLEGETSWDRLGLPEERTTVTNKVRRVGAWDEQLVVDAIRANGGGEYHPDVKIALTMVDQLFPEVRDQTDLTEEALLHVNKVQRRLRTYVDMVGTGPQTVVEL